VQHSHVGKSRTVAGLVLAAGFSRRFGADKRIAELNDGQKLLSASLRLPCSLLQDVWVVVRPDDDLEPLQIPQSSHIVRSERTHDGMGHSIASGMSAVEEQSSATAVAIFLGDMPWINPETLHALIERASADQIVLPTYRGQPGHPVLFGRQFWAQMQGLTGDTGAKAVIQANPQAVQRVEVDDHGILADIDLPQG